MAIETDAELMRRAVELSRRGYPAPNPHVGCVLVKDGRIIGEGWHEYAGGDHAEIAAIKSAQSDVAGATAYVTMEPCNHHGRTGPCSDALIRHGIARVVYALEDPNPVGGGGHAKLQSAGVAVEAGLLADEASSANIKWLTAFQKKRSYVVIKVAISLDGKIARPNGESKWITGPEARTAAHALRAECGAVLVGAGTVRADNPQLTVRHLEVVNQPVRIVLDKDGRLDPTFAVFDDASRTIRVTATDRGSGTLECPTHDGRFDLHELLHRLFQQGITSVLVEGGGHTISCFLEAGLADRIEVFIAPKVFGAGIDWAGTSLLAEHAYRFAHSRSVGEDLWVTLHPQDVGNLVSP